MGGGLMQLVAYGAQDIYLTGNPQITFFKVVYRRHTNFAIEAIEQTFNGSQDFGRKISCTVDRNGDLVHRMYLEVEMYSNKGADLGSRNDVNYTKGTVANNSSSVDDGGWETTCDNLQPCDIPKCVHRFGHALIKDVDVEIGGQVIDKHYGEWLEIWSQLSCTDSELTTLRTMISGGIVSPEGTAKLYIPLQFWFNRNPGLALPLIALQYHEVKINVTLEEACKLCCANEERGYNIKQVCLYCDYIFLDTDERRRFAQVSHEYLIEQLQFNNIQSLAKGESSANVELRFNHPCKELVWVVQPQEAGATSNCTAECVSWTSGHSNTPFRFSKWFDNDGNRGDGNKCGELDCCANNQQDTVLSAKLQLNGHDRFTEREGTYFRAVQPYQHHTGGHRQGGVSVTVDSTKQSVHGEDGFIYVYSFGLKPEEHQPSGTCNFSRIDNANLQLNINTDANCPSTHTALDHYKYVKVYATNYNVLRVMSGMGGLAYSN